MSAPSTTATGSAVVRSNFSFAPGGRHAACVRTRGAESVFEMWGFDSGAARLLRQEPAPHRGAQAQPLADGRVLLFPNSSEPHELVLLDPEGGRRVLKRVHAVAGYLLPHPTSSALGVLVARESACQSAIWRVTDAGAELVLRLPGWVSGGVWLDPRLELLGANLTTGQGRCDGVLVDLGRRRWRTILSLSPESRDSIVACHPGTGLLVIETNAGGHHRLGWARLDGANAVSFPERLDEDGLRHRALAIDPPGKRVLVQRQRGAVTTLHVYTPHDDQLRQLAIPTGVTRGRAHWSTAAIRVPFSSPTKPTTLLTITSCEETSYLPDDGAGGEWVDAELVRLSAAAGGVEAIVYGRDWLRSDRLVLALHGGPLSAWRMQFEPLFQALASAGVAVVAPNYRGSTGYGHEHLSPVLEAWGGPDLDDVVAIGADLGSLRADLPRPMVLGVSYGAFLSLLAASAAPKLWSACVALAPLLSGARLHSASAPWVGHRAMRLGALSEIDDQLGARDVLRLCPEISVPLLLMHGTDDDVIPVGQSRELRDRLLESGCTDLTYQEVPGNHHEVVTGVSAVVRSTVARFCRTWGRP
ncbi:alpha/beta hydrolase family protein [Saccharopolyspora erythraea]|uniref:alpha/beta hydrolase family protein n=1 Tax=Saccharopolyspora erythraea TaxID=1836 RepID=UPI00201157B0|nr:alpha/beta fold hydrolase [Saccharopolyspora erythraea]